MKTIAILAILALLPGCASQDIKAVLDDLSKGCTRHYTFSASSGVPAQATVAGTIDCTPMPGVVGAATTVPSGQQP